MVDDCVGLINLCGPLLNPVWVSTRHWTALAVKSLEHLPSSLSVWRHGDQSSTQPKLLLLHPADLQQIR